MVIYGLKSRLVNELFPLASGYVQGIRIEEEDIDHMCSLNDR